MRVYYSITAGLALLSAAGCSGGSGLSGGSSLSGSSGLNPGLSQGSSIKAPRTAASGEISEYTIPGNEPRFAAFPIGISNGPDGKLWFAERGWGKLGNIATTDGAILQFNLKVKNDDGSRFPQNVVVGSDGNLWATCGTVRTYQKESHTTPDPYGSIRVMTSLGSVTGVYHLPTMYSDPRSIVAGPDNNLWFTESRGAIGQMTTQGALQEFAIDNSNPVYPIAVGPDQSGGQRLWFGETFNDIIGSITTDGTRSYFDLPKGGGPAGIVAGPYGDPHLYATEFRAGKVAQISTSGAVTAEWTLTTSGCSPKGITVGSDGNLYVAEFSCGNIARIIRSGSNVGTVTEFPIPTPHSGPWGIASGPDGNIWFTESLVGKIGKLSIQ